MREYLDNSSNMVAEPEEGSLPPEEEGFYGAVPPPMQEEKESPEIGIIKELSPKKVLEQLRMNLKGCFWDYEKKAYAQIPDMKPLMNEKGIAKYLSIMSSIITDLVTFSNYKDEEVKSLVQYVCDKAIPTIHINYKEYGVQSKSDLGIIDIQIFNLTYAAFKKAVGAGERNVIRGTVSEAMIARTGYPQQMREEGGFLSKINPFTK